MGRIMIVAITDGLANVTLKRSTDPEGIAPDAPRPSSQELQVRKKEASYDICKKLVIKLLMVFVG